VRLIDSKEAKIIANHYGNDSEFREHVNRYVHDFEGIMRLLLSTRDGNAIGVTLLSSDIGKLCSAGPSDRTASEISLKQAYLSASQNCGGQPSHRRNWHNIARTMLRIKMLSAKL
jgi:hypothetical protein